MGCESKTSKTLKVSGREGASCSAVTMRINVSVGTKEDNVQRYCIECMPSSSAAPMESAMITVAAGAALPGRRL